ncbi:MAG: energy transducer TonB [Chthoniobacterales bacterium]
MKAVLSHIVLICTLAASFAQAPMENRLPTIYEHPEQIALKHPTPPFPKKARAQHIQGSGIFALDIDYDSGQVIDAKVFKSTGYKMLDDSAVETLKRWQFRPHTIIHANIPIAFTYSKR